MEIEGIRGNSPVNRMSVDSEGRAYTRAVSSTESEHALSEGRRFGIYSGTIDLTTADRTAVFYLKNQEPQDIVFTGLSLGTGQSTGGADSSLLVEQIGGIQPTDDIVASPTTPGAANNSNLGSAKAFKGDVGIGPNDDFSAGQAGAGTGVRGDFTDEKMIDVLSQVPPGGEIGVTLQAATGNTSMLVNFTAVFHVNEDL